MKQIFIVFLLCVASLFSSQAQKSPYRIFGRITTVENKVLTGYITWGNTRMWWIDSFQASKKNNPYAVYFKDKDVRFKNGNYYATTPTVHAFICRFGDISKIRLVGSNTIELQVKDGSFILLQKGATSDVGGTVQLFDGTVTYRLKWEQISEVEFMQPDKSFVASPEVPITGIVRTPQGIYKGIVNWTPAKSTIQSELVDWNNTKISIPFRDITRIERSSSTLAVQLDDGQTKKLQGFNNFSNENTPLSVNMPNIGRVLIPWNKFNIFEAIPLESINLLSYNDFKAPQRLQGEVLTQDGQKISGIIAYDLDESMDVEILDGMNDNISYRIPFKYVKSVEPKNYKYSYVTLRDGTALSLGDNPDVDETNSGVIVFPEGSTATYIAWKEIKQITFQ